MRTVLLLAALPVLISTACKQKEQPSSAKRPRSPTPRGGRASGIRPPVDARPIEARRDETAARATKLRGYIDDCINAFSRGATSSMNRYYAWTSKDKVPTDTERVIYGLYDISGDPRRCTTAVKKHNAMPPALPALESAGTAYAQALEALVPLVKRAHAYYDQRDDKADKMAKGKELHPKLVAAFDAFQAANRALYRAVDEQQEKLDQVTLEGIARREGKKMLWHLKRSAMAAKRLMSLNTYPDKLDLEAYAKALQAYAGAFAAMEKFADANKGDKYVDKAGAYLRGSRELLKACRELQRRAREKKPYSRSERASLGGAGEWMIGGSPGQVLRAYNRTVDDHNRMMRWWER